MLSVSRGPQPLTNTRGRQSSHPHECNEHFGANEPFLKDLNAPRQGGRRERDTRGSFKNALNKGECKMQGGERRGNGEGATGSSGFPEWGLLQGFDGETDGDPATSTVEAGVGRSRAGSPL